MWEMRSRERSTNLPEVTQQGRGGSRIQSLFCQTQTPSDQPPEATLRTEATLESRVMSQRLFLRGFRKMPSFYPRPREGFSFSLVSGGLKFHTETSCTESPTLGYPANCPRRPQLVSKTRVYITRCFILLFPNQQRNSQRAAPACSSVR